MGQARNTVSELTKKKRYTVSDLVVALWLTQCFTICLVLLILRDHIARPMRDNEPLGFTFDTIDKALSAFTLLALVSIIVIWACFKCLERIAPSSNNTAAEPEGSSHED